MKCCKCGDMNGPWVVSKDKVLCEDCQQLEDITDKLTQWVRNKATTKANIAMVAVTTMDTVSTIVYDKLGII